MSVLKKKPNPWKMPSSAGQANRRQEKLSMQELQKLIQKKLLQDPKLLEKACQVIERWIKKR